MAVCPVKRSSRYSPVVALAVAVSGAPSSFSVALTALQPGEGGTGTGPVQVRGTVVDHDTSEPLHGAAVSLGRAPGGTAGLGTRVTGRQGGFLFRNVPPGPYRLIVTMQGYRDMEHMLQVPSGRDLNLVLPLSVEPIPLEPIVVEARRSTAPGARESNVADPFVITREEIEARHPSTVTDLLRWVPGGRIAFVPGLGKTLLLRAGCQPGFWIDGARIQNVEGIDRVLSPNDVETIRIYNALELPVELGSHVCGGVVIRTRTGNPLPGGEDEAPDARLLRRLGMAFGLLFVALVFVFR